MFLIMLVEGPVLTATGGLASALGYYNVFIVFALSFFANFIPDMLYYGLGRWGGNHALDKYGERFGIQRSRRDRAARFISDHVGQWLIFIKAVPLISPPGLAVMGALGVPIRSFIWWDMLIVALTSLFFVAIGYYWGKGYDFLQGATQYGPWALAGAFLFFILVTQLFSRLGRKLTRRMRTVTADEVPTSGS